MKKNIVKLNESQIQQIVTESVKRILAEGNFNEEDMDERLGDWFGYGARKVGQKAQQFGQGVKDAIQTGKEKFNQGMQNAREYSQARDNQRMANKNAGKVQKYVQTLNDMYNSGLFNGVSYGKRAMAEIQDLIKTLNQVSGSYQGNANAWNKDASQTLQPQG